MSTEPTDIQAKSKDFLDKAKAGNLDAGSLHWGLSAGAIITAVSLPLNYFAMGGNDAALAASFGIKTSFTGLDILTMRHGGSSLAWLEIMCIPVSAIFGLYLHFGEPGAKLLKMETPGRPS